MKKDIYYCKSLKKTGKPIIVYDHEKKSEKHTSRVRFKNVNIEMTFMNSKGRAKRRGATTILRVTRKVRGGDKYG